jgi:hypothetical protein
MPEQYDFHGRDVKSLREMSNDDSPEKESAGHYDGSRSRESKYRTK